MTADLLTEIRLREARRALRAIFVLRIVALAGAGAVIWIVTVYGFHWSDAVSMAAALVLLILTDKVRPLCAEDYTYWKNRMDSRERTPK